MVAKRSDYTVEADEFRQHLDHGLVQEALTKIGGKFASPQHVGPTHVADFEDLSNPRERELLQRDAFELVQALLAKLQDRPQGEK